jgi:uncharacterized cupin superfamily protein
MSKKFENIDEAVWAEGKDSTNHLWRHIDLSGEHLGVRIEEISPGGSSSVHHYHTLEEEHVIMLEGAATLVLGTEEHILREGDHLWFEAGREEAHHIENRTSEMCKFLVFGERNKQDIVVYPEHKVMLVKALGNSQFTYRTVPKSDDS